uniref:Uncharacterized protein n=1 Tax=Acrobeloides nanus TaxID=290746 RepID=A0A914C5Z8_9BILA
MNYDNIPNWKLLCTALIVSLGGSFQFGFQLTIPNPAENAFQNFVNASMKSMGWNPTSSTIDFHCASLAPYSDH